MLDHGALERVVAHCTGAALLDRVSRKVVKRTKTVEIAGIKQAGIEQQGSSKLSLLRNGAPSPRVPQVRLHRLTQNNQAGMLIWGAGGQGGVARPRYQHNALKTTLLIQRER